MVGDIYPKPKKLVNPKGFTIYSDGTFIGTCESVEISGYTIDTVEFLDDSDTISCASEGFSNEPVRIDAGLRGYQGKNKRHSKDNLKQSWKKDYKDIRRR